MLRFSLLIFNIFSQFVQCNPCMEIDQFQHPDSIWTWKNLRGGRAALWLPYLNKIEHVPKSKRRYRFYYNGGDVECPLKDIDFIMIYGGDADLPMQFLDDLGTCGVVLAIHRRNMSRPLYFFPNSPSDASDVLTGQIIARENNIRRAYISRTLISKRIESFSWLIPIPGVVGNVLRQARSISAIRAIEAEWTKRYWDAYFRHIGFDSARRSESPVQAALDAGSKFLSGILLRWILFHKLAPTHGFLHEPTTYTSLVYDLIEPYRVWIELSVANSYTEGCDEKKLVAATIALLKDMLLEEVHLPAFQESTRRKNVLHAQVLALRSYLVGETPRFVVPVEGQRIGGRPVKASFSIPGAKR